MTNLNTIKNDIKSKESIINLFFILPGTPSDILDEAETNIIESANKYNNNIIKLKAKVNENILEVISQNEDLQKYIPGNCGGQCACSTCHISFYQKDFDRFELNNIIDEEDDMLYSAYDLSSTSRLACQVKVREQMNNLAIKIMFNGYDTL